jgi:hypothetical protein
MFKFKDRRDEGMALNEMLLAEHMILRSPE